MTSTFRPAGLFAFLAPLSLVLPIPVLAQDHGGETNATRNQAVAAAVQVPEPTAIDRDDPWLFRGGDIPVDPAWFFGEMDNGLRYATRKNGVPPGQVSIRIRIDAGSLYESEFERGFAHLIEHLAFRESKYLAAGEAIPTWQRLGASFGSDTNAETSPTHTVYKLDLPNATPAKLDETFRLLSGMMRDPVLSRANLAAEVPIVLAELRERAGPNQRAFEETKKTFYRGQLLAERSPIGTVETLQAATPATVQAFHDRWYRPELTVISAVGDIDAQLMAGLVEKYFGDWQVDGPVPPQPDFGTPVAPVESGDALPLDEIKVVVEPDLPHSVNLAYVRPWEQVTDNLEYNRGLILDQLAMSIINRRLESRARGDARYLFAQVDTNDVSRSVNGTYVSLTPIDGDWEGALEDVRLVIEDALTTPPSQQEIDREAAEYILAFENGVEQQSILAGAGLADEIVTAVDIREMIATPETRLALVTGMTDRYNPDEMFRRTQRLFQATAVRAVLVTPEAVAGGQDAVRLALTSPLAIPENIRDERTVLTFADLPPIGAPGQVVDRRQVSRIGFERVEFANGVTALIWPTTNEPGRATVKVRWGAGYRAFTPDQAAEIALGEFALVPQGFGELDLEELDRIATGRKFGFNFNIGDGVFSLDADTRRADVRDQLYLFAGKLSDPRWDEAPLRRAKSALQTGYETYGASPIGVVNRDLSWLLAGKDGRFSTPTPDEVAAVSAAEYRAVWEPLLQQGAIEVLVFGDIETEATVRAIADTFGALAPREPIPAGVTDRPVTFLPGTAEPIVLTHRGAGDQAAAAVAWETGGGSAAIAEARKLEILSQLFTNRLMDALRERAGASYAPQVVSDWPVDVSTGGNMLAIAQLPPETAPAFFAEADAIAADLAANGPSEDELARVTEPLRQLLLRIQTGHGFWLGQVEGATTDQGRIDSLATLLPDFTRTTPEEMRALAAKYFVPGEAVKIVVLPEAGTAGAVGGASGR